jgi:hypothetical protein
MYRLENPQQPHTEDKTQRYVYEVSEKTAQQHFEDNFMMGAVITL